jgi:hypothetical protein
MYYHSFHTAAGKFKVGMASSKDGFNWKKEGVVFEGGSSQADFDAGGAAACHVVSGRYSLAQHSTAAQCCIRGLDGAHS